jgi:hypothetical protein
MPFLTKPFGCNYNVIELQCHSYADPFSLHTVSFDTLYCFVLRVLFRLFSFKINHVWYLLPYFSKCVIYQYARLIVLLSPTTTCSKWFILVTLLWILNNTSIMFSILMILVGFFILAKKRFRYSSFFEDSTYFGLF